MSSGMPIALMMEVVRTSETSVNFYQTAHRNNPEDSHLQNGQMMMKDICKEGRSVFQSTTHAFAWRY
jgi:hypothetical protein